jgi:hypothetical protein
MTTDDSLPNSTSTEANLSAIGDLLQDALTRLDAIGRFDVSVHVDLALHQLRGTRNVFHTSDEDTPA